MVVQVVQLQVLLSEMTSSLAVADICICLVKLTCTTVYNLQELLQVRNQQSNISKYLKKKNLT